MAFCGGCFKFLRGVRSVCLPVGSVVLFSLLLTWIFILNKHGHGPGLVQKISWQSWETAYPPNFIPASSKTGPTKNETIITLPNPVDAGNSPDGGDLPQDVDWWNVTKPKEIDYASLPLDVWSPLIPHDTGLSEITVAKCYLNPHLSEEFCAPETTSESDSIRGKWVRVRRDLNREGTYASGYLSVYYRRTRRQDVPLVNDVKLLPENDTPSQDPRKDRWHKAELSLRAGIRGSPPLFLWYQTGKTASEMSTQDKNQMVTEIDVLFGDDDPWYGFERLQPATMAHNGKIQSTWLTIRKGIKIPPRAPPLHFSRDGKFKIMQVADLHYSVSQGLCRDTDLSPCEASDNLTNTLIGRMLDAEKPDLVVFTGDQLNGQGTSWDAKSVLAKFSKAAAERKIPWATVFGNHDDNDGVPREAQIAWLESMPYSLVQRGPKDIHGVGNYVLKVRSADASKTHLLTLYFLDSGAYSKGFIDWFGFFNPTEYDWIRKNQIDWFLQESASIKPIQRPFSPDTGKDLGGLWARQQPDQLTPTISKLAKPNAVTFFHMPLPETYDKADIDPTNNQPLDVGITGMEMPGNAKSNDGFFENGILKAYESDHTSNRGIPEVKVIGNGHCHLTENCRRVKGVWFCFGGGGSYSAYGKVGFDRRFRIYDISDYGETIRTYKRTEKDEIVDDMILAGKGAPPL
ncbi:phosphatase DCR2 [Coprinopsis marcescibilis]|uniref:Phosphatase DCR2 n=1 Tax=Coprinopsis marcescibilis TaxID=230819 RepID=A0A5C3L9N5_COPMA|nr:phosphatase DCR2 [Coprinopsis marcescibilis]